MEKRCYGCMKEKKQSPVCEHCGFSEERQNQPHQLPMGKLLHNQYLVGRVLGQGGFGITYLGYDINLDTPVAVKEFFPSGIVGRDATAMVTNTAGGGQFTSGMARFLREAKILAKFKQVPEIVKIYNVFQENGTAYIVMEYVEGLDLKTYLKRLNRLLTPQETFSLLRPIMRGLEKVHQAGLVHRDISPDNIMLQRDGTVKLLDFGTARDVDNADPEGQIAHSTQAILKYGFAPIEQYQSRGSLGPWTDEYSLVATAYYCMTGKVPPEAPDRMMEDKTLDWSTIPGLTEKQIEALSKGMAIQAAARFSSVEELEQALFTQEPQPEPEPEPQPEPQIPVVVQTGVKKSICIAATAAALAMGIGVGGIGMYLLPGGEEGSVPDIIQAEPETKIYTVKFDAQGGDSAVTASQTVEDGTLREFPEASWDGRQFDGWYTAAFGGDKITADSQVAADTTLYAHWTDLEATKKPSEAKPVEVKNVKTGVRIRWNAVDGVKKYGLWRSANAENGTYKWLCNPVGTEYIDTNVVSGKTYYYKITTMDTSGNHSQKSTENLSTTYISTPDFTRRLNLARGISLTWNKVEGATGYTVYRRPLSGTGDWEQLYSTKDASELTWLDTSVQSANGQGYRYAVCTLSAAGESVPTSEKDGRAMVRMTSLTLNECAVVSGGTVKCAWTTNDAATGYEIRFMEGSEIKYQFTLGDKTISERSFEGIASGHTYKVQVRAYQNLDGIGGFYTAWSAPQNLTVK